MTGAWTDVSSKLQGALAFPAAANRCLQCDSSPCAALVRWHLARVIYDRIDELEGAIDHCRAVAEDGLDSERNGQLLF